MRDSHILDILNLNTLFETVGEIPAIRDRYNYLEKALQLYELCNLQTDTYSIKRETNIIAINNFLKSNNY